MKSPEGMDKMLDVFVEAMEAYAEHIKSLPPGEVPHSSTRAYLKGAFDRHLEYLEDVEQEARITARYDWIRPRRPRATNTTTKGEQHETQH